MGERDQEALAAWIASALEPEAGRELGHARAGRVGRRERPSVLVEPRLALVRERQQPEHLVEHRRLDRDRLVERQPERVEQRVERVPPLGLHYSRGRSAGKRITSRIVVAAR